MMSNVVTFTAGQPEPVPPTGVVTEATAPRRLRAAPSPERLALAKSRIEQALQLLDNALGRAREIETRLSDPATKRQFGEQVANIEGALQHAVQRIRQL